MYGKRNVVNKRTRINVNVSKSNNVANNNQMQN